MYEMNKIIVDRSRPRLRGTIFAASIGQPSVKLFERHHTKSSFASFAVSPFMAER